MVTVALTTSKSENHDHTPGNAEIRKTEPHSIEENRK